VGSDGSIYIAESEFHVRKVSPNGIITTIAGNGISGYSGDGGDAASAELRPGALAVDASGNVYVADWAANAIRRLKPVAGLIDAAVNGASQLTTPVAPGGIATVYGILPLSAPSQATSATLPTSLAGLSIQLGGGVEAPLFYASSGQVNLQVPWELAGQSQVPLTAIVNGQSGAAQMINLSPFSPGIFSMNGQGTGQGAILDPSYRLVDSSNPAAAGGTVIAIYCTGLGAVSNQPVSGSPAPVSPLAVTTTTPTVSIGGQPAQVWFSGLAPGSVGLYQVNAQVPAGVASGAAVPVVVSIGGATSNTVTIAVK
jgi:uncharacterized protein (TIGR03437 family)